ncbi:MAG: hypothetical protein KGZ79_15570 [Dethiobacter sp.]|jgi:hypothetical protein|nr:hypothetical protein [Dethiobacter sp.]
MLKKCRLFFLLFLALLLFPAAGGFAGINFPADWEFHKEIQLSTGSGYKALFLDEEVYRHARTDLADLRVADAKGELFPYYIHTGSAAEKLTETLYVTTLADQFKKDGATYLDFKASPLQQNADILGNKLVFSLPAFNFLKNIEVYGSHDGVVWDFLIRDTVYRVDNLIKNQLMLPETKKYGYYRIKIPDNVEKIQLGLQLVHSFREREYENYQRSRVLQSNVRHEDKYTYITLDNSSRLRIKNIHLSINENFQRKFEVYDDNGLQLYSGGLHNLQFKDYNIKNTVIGFAHTPVSAEKITIKINNLDNRPLDISSIRVDYLLDKAVFEHKGSGAYRLYFGNPQAVKPNYEIELYKSHVEREEQNFLTLGALVRREEPEAKQAPFRMDIAFNIVIGAVSLLLVLFLARKLSVKD